MLTTTDGVEIFTQQWITPNPKAGVVLTHGWNDHSGRYEHVGAALNQGGYSLYAYDLRGHGRSGGRPGDAPSYDQLHDDLQLVIDLARRDAPGKKVFVYGHSMGGNITLNYALRRPEGLSGALVTGPWLKLTREPPAPLVAAIRLLRVVAPAFPLTSALEITGLSRDEAVQRAYAADPLLHRKITPRLALAVNERGLRAVAEAARLRLPVLLMHGAADPITSPAATQDFFHKAAGDKTLKLYEAMRHEIHNELGKEAVFADMLAWLDQRATA